MHSRFVPVVVWVRSSFTFIVEDYSVVLMYHGCSAIHQLKDMWMFPMWGDDDEGCYEYSHTGFYVNIFSFTCMAQLYIYFNTARKCQTVLQKGYTTLHSLFKFYFYFQVYSTFI